MRAPRSLPLWFWAVPAGLVAVGMAYASLERPAVAVFACLAPFPGLAAAFWSRRFQGWEALLGLGAACLLTPLALLGLAVYAYGAIMAPCLLILHPAQTAPSLLGVVAVGVGLRRLLLEPSGRGRGAMALALAAAGLALSLSAGERLRVKCGEEPDWNRSIRGWRFKFEGPEEGRAKPRLFVATGDPRRPFKVVFECPPGTSPRPGRSEDVGAGGLVCDR